MKVYDNLYLKTNRLAFIVKEHLATSCKDKELQISVQEKKRWEIRCRKVRKRKDYTWIDCQNDRCWSSNKTKI